MTSTRGRQLDNKYVEEYYDAQVGALPVSYEKDRWHTSPVKEFEYRQTLRALEHALGKCAYEQAIEIGPGDGVWTRQIRAHVKGSLHLIEQSEAMLSQAKQNLAAVPGITFERSDFLTSDPVRNNDLIVAMRCFEYFDDKEGALKKMRDLLCVSGKIIIVTKNSQLFTSKGVQDHTLHSDQLSKQEMYQLAASAGLAIEAAYPAIIRFKAALAPMRFIFDILHRIGVWSNGTLVVPVLTTHATESYVYILSAKK